MTPSGIELATFHLVVQCLKQLRNRVPLPLVLSYNIFILTPLISAVLSLSVLTLTMQTPLSTVSGWELSLPIRKIPSLFPLVMENKRNTQAATHTSKRATTMDHEMRTAGRETNCHEKLSKNTPVLRKIRTRQLTVVLFQAWLKWKWTCLSQFSVRYIAWAGWHVSAYSITKLQLRYK